MKTISALTLAMTCTLASADIVGPGRVTATTDVNTGISTVNLDLSGLIHKSTEGSPTNTTFLLPVGPDAELVGFGVNFWVSTQGASIVADARFNFEDYFPGFPDPAVDLNDNRTGVSNVNVFGPPVFFSDFPLPTDRFLPGPDGIFEIELYDRFIGNGGDGVIHESGSTMTFLVTNYVPAPGSAAMLGLASFAAARRRR